MDTPTRYKITALVDLKYRLKEKPTLKEGYPLAEGDSLTILKEALGWIRFITLDGKSVGTKAYTVEALV